MFKHREMNEKAIKDALMFQRAFSVIRLANNGSYELAETYNPRVV